jgi:endoglucanase
MFFSKLAAAVAALASTTLAQNSTSKLKWFGINESGAEFGETSIPGLYGKHYTWYDLNTIDQFMEQGVNHFRLNFCTPNLPVPPPILPPTNHEKQ